MSKINKETGKSENTFFNHAKSRSKQHRVMASAPPCRFARQTQMVRTKNMQNTRAHTHTWSVVYKYDVFLMCVCADISFSIQDRENLKIHLNTSNMWDYRYVRTLNSPCLNPFMHEHTHIHTPRIVLDGMTHFWNNWVTKPHRTASCQRTNEWALCMLCHSLFTLAEMYVLADEGTSSLGLNDTLIELSP